MNTKKNIAQGFLIVPTAYNHNMGYHQYSMASGQSFSYFQWFCCNVFLSIHIQNIIVRKQVTYVEKKILTHNI